jgi:DNA repair exonuclease SbcCD ATPase subunit
MKIEYIRAKNFLSIGEEPVEIDFAKLGKIVLIDGKNLDFQGEPEDFEGLFVSNAAGKSTISEIIVYGLYGETIRKRVTHTQAIHNKTKKRLEVEVIFTMDNVRYRVLRTRLPDSVRLWQEGPPWIDQGEDNSNEITMGGQPATQSKIEGILKMNHKAFINVVYFGQHNDYNFLECSAADQREIAESLLSLEDFKDYCKQAKDDVKDFKLEIKQLTAVYEQIISEENNGIQRIEQIKRKKKDWEANCQREITAAEKQYKDTEDQLAATDMGPALIKYDRAQVELVELKDELSKKNEHEGSLDAALEQAKNGYDKIREKIHDLTLSRRSAQQELQDRIKERTTDEDGVERLEKLPQGAQCPHCYGKIDKQHYKHVMLLHKNRLETVQPKIDAAEAKIKQLDEEITKYKQHLTHLEGLKNTVDVKLNKLASDISTCKSRINELSKIQRPDLSSKEIVLKERLAQLETSIANKKKELAEGGPYVEILDGAQKDLAEVQTKKEEHHSKLDELDETLQYYEWWAHGFDDIRSFIIERIIDPLNTRIAMWLDYLIQGKLKVTFDKHLAAKIESLDGDAYTYFAMCGSEKRRINLAISQSFAYIMMLSSGTWPSLVFLDEVSDSICQRGVYDVYKMICELSNEKQVFIITHNVNLRKMLDGVDTITMVKEGGQSHIE